MNNFLQQVWRLVGQVPFATDAIALYFCLLDTRTPVSVKVTIAAALTYFLLPSDAIPDILVGLGFTDDATVIATTLTSVAGSVTEEHRQQASQFLSA